jgi:hypothetical protein
MACGLPEATFSVLVVLFAREASAAPRCELGPHAWLEGRIADGSEKLARAVDARRGETLDVFVAVPGKLDGRAVVFGESGARGRVSWTGAGCPGATVSWRRVEPRMQHQATPAPNADVALYANAVIFGPKHGTWIGFDHIEYSDTSVSPSFLAPGITSSRSSKTAARTAWPDGVLGPDDLVADSGDAAGLKFAPLREQGAVRVVVLRPPANVSEARARSRRDQPP